MTPKCMKRVCEDFERAAELCVEAGFDALDDSDALSMELHLDS